MTVFELRQYTLHPGRRDELIALFERYLVESQEAVGMRVIGTFRDLGDPDRFVWIRGFADMTARRAGLRGFYGGPVWAQHRAAANATMVDSDDVLLLTTVDGEFETVHRPPLDAASDGGESWPSRVLAVVQLGDAGELDLATARALLDVPVVAMRTSEEVNDFPALPVRAERAVVWFARFPDAAGLKAGRAALESHSGWQAAGGGVQLLELEPTPRSTYR